MAVNNHKKPRIVIYGVGQFGQHIIRFADQKGWPIVAAFNRAGDKVGKDIGQLAGLNKNLSVVVQDCDTANYDNIDADIAVMATTDRIKNNLLGYKRMMNAGLNVICHATEAYYPEGIDAEVSTEIDAVAKKNKVTFTGSGIWDMSRIWAGILIVGPNTEIDGLSHVSVTDNERIGEGLMLVTGVGMTPKEYKEKITDVDGLMGGLYKTIPQHVAEALGYTTTRVVERREPVLYDTAIYCRLLARDIPPGECAGTRIVIDVETKEGIKIAAHIELRILREGETEHMTWKVDGKPSSTIRIERDDSGHASASSMFNRIHDVIAAPAGVQVVSTLGVLKHSALM